MPVLTREQIRAAAKKACKTVDVPLPEPFGGSVRLRQLTGGALVDYQASVHRHQTAGTEGELVFEIIQVSAETEDGTPLWPDKEGLEDVRALPQDVLQLLAEAASELNEVSAETVEAEAKN